MKFPRVARTLLGARELLERDGWVQGSLGTTCGPKCAWGAIDAAVGGDPQMFLPAALEPVSKEAVDALLAVTHAPNLPEWNDAPGRTEADVLAAFDAAASLALSEAQR